MFKERAFAKLHRTSIEHPAFRVGKKEIFFCARRRHVEQPFFLFQFFPGFLAVHLERDDALFAGGDEYRLKLKPLGGMHRHQEHGLAPAVNIIHPFPESAVLQELVIIASESFTERHKTLPVRFGDLLILYQEGQYRSQRLLFFHHFLQEFFFAAPPA